MKKGYNIVGKTWTPSQCFPISMTFRDCPLQSAQKLNEDLIIIFSNSHWTKWSTIQQVTARPSTFKIRRVRYVRPIWNYEHDYSLNCTPLGPISNYSNWTEWNNSGSNCASNFKIGWAWSTRLIWNNYYEHNYSLNCMTQGPITN